ncbi:hypothetical protein CR513_57691, partial [Mucuna pruriens]
MRVSKDLKKIPMEELLGALKFHNMEPIYVEIQERIKMEEQLQKVHQGDERQDISSKPKHFKFECPNLEKEKEKKKKKSFIEKKKSLMAT